MSDLVRGRQDEDRSLGQVVMDARAILVFDVTLEDVRDDLLSEVGVQVAFLTGSGDALREALEREERFPLPRREEDPSRDIGVVEHPMHEGHRSGFTGTGQETFLQMNPEEKFDLEAVNSIDTRALLEQARGDKHVLREVIRTAEALLPRVRAETEDPILVSGILRDKTLDWYRRSPTDRTWTDTVPLRWGW